MKLHEDREAFSVLLNSVSEQTGIRMDILKPDFNLLSFYSVFAQVEMVKEEFNERIADLVVSESEDKSKSQLSFRI